MSQPQQRACLRIFDLLDSGRAQAALQECNRNLGISSSDSSEKDGQDGLLSPPEAAAKLPLAESLKAASLMRLRRRRAALDTADRLVQNGFWYDANTTMEDYNQAALAVSDVYTQFGLPRKAASLLEEAFNKKQTGKPDELMGQKAFEALVMAGEYQKAQLVALKLYKGLSQPTLIKTSKGKTKKDPKGHYFWWSMTCYLLMARSAEPDQGNLFLALAERMIAKQTSLEHLISPESSSKASSSSSFDGSPAEVEHFQLFLSVLIKQQKWDVAFRLLETDAGRAHVGLPARPADGQGVTATTPLALGSPTVDKGKGALDSASTTPEVSGNPDIKEIRWKVLTEMKNWAAIREEAAWRIRRGERDWETLKLLIRAAVLHSDVDVLEETRAFLDSLLPASILSTASGSAPAEGAGNGEPSGASTSGSKNKKKRQAQNKRKAAAMKERALLLARIDLQCETIKAQGNSGGRLEQEVQLLAAILDYFGTFSTKRCAFEDLKPYALQLSSDHRAPLRDNLSKLCPGDTAAEDEQGLVRFINARKLEKLLQPVAGTTSASEVSLAKQYLDAYIKNLPIGKHLPKTEMQPADDLAFLSASSLVLAWHLSKTEGTQTSQGLLLDAANILVYALKASPKGYILRLLLIKICIKLGAFEVARAHFDQLDVKSVQQDSMTHWLLDRASAFSSAGSDVKETIERLSKVYRENEEETPRFIHRAFHYANYSRAEEMTEFYECLHFSLNKHLTKTQRMLAFLSAGDEDGAKNLASEILASFGSPAGPSNKGAKLRDQRDFGILPDYSPDGATSLIDIIKAGPISLEGSVKWVASLVNGDAPQALPKDELSNAEIALHSGADLLFETAKASQCPFDLLHSGELALQIKTLSNINKHIPPTVTKQLSEVLSQLSAPHLTDTSVSEWIVTSLGSENVPSISVEITREFKETFGTLRAKLDA